MDVLGLSPREIQLLDVSDYFRAVKYSWNVFNLRRTDLPFRKSENKEVMTWNQDHILTSKVSKLRQKTSKGAHKT